MLIMSDLFGFVCRAVAHGNGFYVGTGAGPWLHPTPRSLRRGGLGTGEHPHCGWEGVLGPGSPAVEVPASPSFAEKKAEDGHFMGWERAGHPPEGLLFGVGVVVVLPGAVDFRVEPCVDLYTVGGQSGCGCGEGSALVCVEVAVSGCDCA